MHALPMCCLPVLAWAIQLTDRAAAAPVQMVVADFNGLQVDAEIKTLVTDVGMDSGSSLRFDVTVGDGDHPTDVTDVYLLVIRHDQLLNWQARFSLLHSARRVLNTHFTSAFRLPVNNGVARGVYVVPEGSEPMMHYVILFNVPGPAQTFGLSGTVTAEHVGPTDHPLVQYRGYKTAQLCCIGAHMALVLSMVIAFIRTSGQNHKVPVRLVFHCAWLRAVVLTCHYVTPTHSGIGTLPIGVVLTIGTLEALQAALEQLTLLLTMVGYTVVRSRLAPLEWRIIGSASVMIFATSLGAVLTDARDDHGIRLCRFVVQLLCAGHMALMVNYNSAVAANMLGDFPISTDVISVYHKFQAFTYLRALVFLFILGPVMEQSFRLYLVGWRDEWAALIYKELVKWLTYCALFVIFVRKSENMLVRQTVEASGAE